MGRRPRAGACLRLPVPRRLRGAFPLAIFGPCRTGFRRAVSCCKALGQSPPRPRLWSLLSAATFASSGSLSAVPTGIFLGKSRWSPAGKPQGFLLCQLLIAAVTTHYKRNALNNTRLPSGRQKSKVKVSAGLLSSPAPGRTHFPPLPTLEAACIPWLCPLPSSPDSPCITLTSAPVVTSPSLTLVACLPLVSMIVRTLVILLGSPRKSGILPHLKVLTQSDLQLPFCHVRHVFTGSRD